MPVNFQVPFVPQENITAQILQALHQGASEKQTAIENQERQQQLGNEQQRTGIEQQRAIDRLKKAEQRRIPEWFDYRAVSGLSREMQEKLGKVIPQTLGQASRIPGVTPAAVSLIHVYIEIQGRRREQAAAL